MTTMNIRIAPPDHRETSPRILRSFGGGLSLGVTVWPFMRQ